MPDVEEPHLQHFSLLRELAEVYLLLDNLSGSATKDLGADSPDAPKLADAGSPSGDWIERVCRIAWPPNGTEQKEAEDIADLIRVRDYLNRRAAPANGGTIAFTLLVGDEARAERASKKRAKATSEAAREPDRQAEGGEQGDGSPSQASQSRTSRAISRAWGGREPLSRVGLANLAFPGLQDRARKFRSWMFTTALGLTGVLLLTCLLSWDTANGNALLAQLTNAQADVLATQAQIATATGGDQSSGPSQAAPATQAKAPVALPASPATVAPIAPPPLVTAPKPFVRYCDQPKYLAATRTDAHGVDVFVSATQAKLCDDLDRKNAAVGAASANLRHWLGQWRWQLHLQRKPPPPPCDPSCARYRADAERAGDTQYASSLLSVLIGVVLPFFYGLLGAGAAVVRSLSFKLRDWQLAPRDQLISLIQLALGAVLGACIGLFVNPTGGAGVGAEPGAAAASPGLLGPVHLSAAALCFIAGFFVEGVFRALEALMRRVFNLEEPSQKSTR